MRERDTLCPTSIRKISCMRETFSTDDNSKTSNQDSQMNKEVASYSIVGKGGLDSHFCRDVPKSGNYEQYTTGISIAGQGDHCRKWLYLGYDVSYTCINSIYDEPLRR
jgi:hypothetical protein